MTAYLDRRELIRSGLLGGAFCLARGPLAAAGLGGGFRQGTDRVLVVVELGGGNDGLNTVVPFAMDEYYAHRRSLGIPRARCLPLDDSLGLNRRLGGLRSLYDRGRLAVVHGVGYARPRRSHFESSDVWHSADPSPRAKTTGWLGRLADICCADRVNPYFAVSISRREPLALRGRRCRPISFDHPDSYRYRGAETHRQAFEELNSPGAADHQVLAEIGRRALDAQATSAGIRSQVRSYRSAATYPPGALGSALGHVAALIGSDLPTGVYYVRQSGFDTHANQAPRQDRLLGELDAALLAFQEDLEHSGSAGRVTTVVFSEFGRRVTENASGGTDHGSAGPVFLLGPGVRGGMHGRHPDLADLDDGDLRHTTDFRSVYASVLTDWMGVEADAVLGSGPRPLELFAS